MERKQNDKYEVIYSVLVAVFLTAVVMFCFDKLFENPPFDYILQVNNLVYSS